MTVTTTNSQVSYVGDGASVTFPFPYYFLASTDIQAFINGVLQTSGFTVAGAGSPLGGAVSFTSAPIAGAQIILLRNPDTLQNTAFPPNDPFPSAANERALDKLTMLCQLIVNKLSKTLSFPIYESFSAVLASASQRASTLLGFDPLGNVAYFPQTASIGAGDMRVDTFTAGVDFVAGTTTQLTLSRAPGNTANLEIFYDGFFQGPDQWGVNGTTVTFNTPIPVGVGKVFARIGTTLSTQVPAVGSVGSAQIAAGAVGDPQLTWGSILNRVVNTIAALRALDKTKYSRAFATGYYASGDGGGGAYWYDPTDTTSVDNGGTIIVATDGGRWKLAYSGALSVKQFGAKGDGATDDTTAFNKALAAVSNVLVPDSPAGYLVTGTITIAGGQTLAGSSLQTKILGTSATSTILFTGGTFSPISGVSNLWIDMTGAPPGSSAMLFATGAANVGRIRIHDMNFTNCYQAIGQQTSAFFISDVQFRNVQCSSIKGRQIYLSRSNGFILLNSVSVATTGGAYESMRFENYAGLECERLDVFAGAETGVFSGVLGIVFGGASASSALWLRRVLCDSTAGNGIIIQNTTNVQGENIEAYANLGFQMQIIGCTDVQLDNVYTQGASGLTGAVASSHGLFMQNCTNITVDKIFSYSNTGDGVLLDGVLKGTFGNWRTRLNGSVGWAETAGTNNFNIKTNGISDSNTGSSLVQNGAASACCNWVAQAGAFRASDVGSLTVA